ncbi:MAG: dATP pyrophosphohydrolase [Rhodothermales bacterium]
MPEIVVANVDVYVHRSAPEGVRHLLLRRAVDRLYEGTWRMVAGKIADGEQAWQAAVRELWEETGLAPQALFAIPSMNQFYEWQTDRVQSIPAFAAAVSGDPTLNEEHDLFEWLLVDEAEQRLAWPEQRRLLRLVDHMVSSGAVPEAVRIPV